MIFEHIALTEAQIVARRRPTAPRKATDNRSFAGAGDDPEATVQAESLDLATLSQIVEDAILSRWDADAAKALSDQEARDRRALARWPADADFGKRQ